MPSQNSSQGSRLGSARIYYPLPIRGAALIDLDEAQSHYLLHVLRLRVGASVSLFNADDGEWQAGLVASDSKIPRAQLRVQEQSGSDTESPLRIHLGQAISRGKRMDYVVQKATELGVVAITPLISERCQLRQPANKTRHWQRIAEQATRQCLRTQPPRIDHPQRLNDWFGTLDVGLRLVMHESTLPAPPIHKTLKRLAARDRGLDGRKTVKQEDSALVLLVGPEGGFSPAEMDLILQQGFYPWLLGPRLLRTETAAPAALAILQYLYGDLGDAQRAP